jgi:large subunit ribosomal protein L2
LGKPLRNQRRGKGSPAFAVPSHRFLSDGKYRVFNGKALISDIVHDRGHSSPFLQIEYEDGQIGYIVAPEGVFKYDEISFGGSDVKLGNILKLSAIPESVPISNIESAPGDGGKFVRTSGSYGYVIQKLGKKVTVRLGSGALREFAPDCRATIGVVAGGGRTEKPMVKAGVNFWAKKAKNKRYPDVRGVAMNPCNHPFGGKEHHKGRSSAVSRNAPPGRKVGHIAASRLGRGKG